jgi:hypothetical protein
MDKGSKKMAYFLYPLRPFRVILTSIVAEFPEERFYGADNPQGRGRNGGVVHERTSLGYGELGSISIEIHLFGLLASWSFAIRGKGLNEGAPYGLIKDLWKISSRSLRGPRT